MEAMGIGVAASGAFMIAPVIVWLFASYIFGRLVLSVSRLANRRNRPRTPPNPDALRKRQI